MAKVLFVYYSTSHQTERAADAMAEVLSARGYAITKAAIEFTDPHYVERFSRWSKRHPIMTIVAMAPAQLRRKSGKIRIPPEAQSAEYDLVVVGSPTWCATTCMPVRSFLEDPVAEKVLRGKPFAAFTTSCHNWKGNIATIRALGTRAGGNWQGETHFVAEGNQVTSMLAWLGSNRHSQPRTRLFGLRLPRPNLRPDYKAQAQNFIEGLADQALTAEPARGRAAAPEGWSGIGMGGSGSHQPHKCEPGTITMADPSGLAEEPCVPGGGACLKGLLGLGAGVEAPVRVL